MLFRLRVGASVRIPDSPELGIDSPEPGMNSPETGISDQGSWQPPFMCFVCAIRNMSGPWKFYRLNNIAGACMPRIMARKRAKTNSGQLTCRSERIPETLEVVHITHCGRSQPFDLRIRQLFHHLAG